MRQLLRTSVWIGLVLCLVLGSGWLLATPPSQAAAPGTGTGTTAAAPAARPPRPPSGTGLEIEAGYDHTCEHLPDATLACWGNSAHGESTPPGGFYNAFDAGFYDTCGIKLDYTLICWG